MDKDNQLRVRSFDNNKIIIEIIDFNKWKAENTDADIKIGSFLKIEDGNFKSIITMVQSFKMAESLFAEEAVINTNYSGNFLLETYPIGQLDGEGYDKKFIKGIKNISIPPTSVSILSESEFKVIFQSANQPFVFSKHSTNSSIDIMVDGDKFFSKHLAVVGSTGSGKSCTVAKIIQEANKENYEYMKNTHIMIFDIHGEYSSAFNHNSRFLSIENNSLILPYWLMNSEELEDFFIESNESNSHNQISQFKKAVICNKKKHNPSINVTYDSPVYFDLEEVICYLDNKNKESRYFKDECEYYAVENTKITCLDDDIPDEMWQPMKFLQPTGNSKSIIVNSKISKGPFNGEFNRFLSRFETKKLDNRLNFMLNQNHLKTPDFFVIMKNILGYPTSNLDYSNITIIDLSSLPFEIVSIVVSIITRFTFDYCYYKTKIASKNDTPFLLVFEEAHKYIPKLSDVKYRNTRMAVERVAKEGRKYGLSSMIVSQRPSELSPTVFSQCNNFVVMRLTNPEDQNYVKRLLPDSFIGYTDSLSILETKEALLVGDAISTPCLVKVNNASPVPKSEDILFLQEWEKPWKEVTFEEVFQYTIREKVDS
ncbi:ATP-binding protein [Peribacillus sp. NJ11]|uniref:ATP-binding protein n=1 Tax=Peribacillus sp. NJ11 TaxID=3055861 RepID=UPI0025A2FA64|nr:ATP-binding protein [Peribacillus sp. NJ11]MDM5220333.1 ATP-binding protein [Peribacillus sp. NJ11]